MASFTNYCTGSFQRWSGKEVLSPAPPPLRTGRAPFDASSSSIEQRLYVARPASVPPAHDTPYGRGRPIGLGVNLDVTANVPVTEDRRGRTTALPPVTSALPPEPVGCRFPSADTRGKSTRFARGDVPTPIRPLRAGLRFLPVLYPPPRRLALRLAFLAGATNFTRCIAGILVG